MKYQRLTISVYNKTRHEPDSFHVDCLIDREMTHDEMLEAIIKPAFHFVFSRMIPEMPPLGSVGGNPTKAGMKRLEQWEAKYFGYPNA